MNSLDKMKDLAAKAAFGRTRSEALEKQICIQCATDMLDLRTEVERKEYSLSALCGTCQRDFFK